MISYSKQIIFALFLFVPFLYLGQDAEIFGTVKDEFRNSIPFATISIESEKIGQLADDKGQFSLKVPINKELTIEVTFQNYSGFKKKVYLEEGQRLEIFPVLKTKQLSTVVIEDKRIRRENIIPIEPKIAIKVPSVRGGIEDLIVSQLGVSSNNELSSSYSVRGGSFDENLVYVNDIQVYRPFLARSGQQEGLSFPNPNMVSSILFSAGGFEAKYGDKMSSVLDIKYAKPQEFEASVQGSLLGYSGHFGTRSKNRRLSTIQGFRYKTNRYILGSLDTGGDYEPAFTDFQSYITYALSDQLELGFLGNYAVNNYRFVPEDRQTDFGSINEALRFTVFFEGQEITRFETLFGALNLNYQSNPNTLLKFIASAFNTEENENFDIIGLYRLDELERDLGSDEFGDVVRNIGVGGYLSHSRNRLDANVFNFEHKGYKTWGGDKKYLQWGASFQLEQLTDRISEWQLIDSSGYSIPINPRDSIVLFDIIKTQNELDNSRLQTYIQNSWEWLTKDSSEMSLTAGVRATYWTYNKETNISPRASISFKPKNWSNKTKGTKRDVLLKFSTGLYYQPPFYKEFRGLFGEINNNIKAQRSIHFVLGYDQNIEIWNRPFKFISEAYYKQLNNLVPYELDNVRLRYYANNDADGFATGIDFKLSGEFIKGVTSWASMSVMTVQENLRNDSFDRNFNSDDELIVPGFTFNDSIVRTETIMPGNIPRPTDQRLNFSLFFQDELRTNPSIKAQLSFLYGTGLPFGPPTFERYKDTLRLPAYRRVDVGITKQFIDLDTELKNPNSLFKHVKEAWVTLEIFNMLGINNTISKLWVQDISGRQYSIPNFLTGRRVNLKLVARF
ncbi:MAG: carboxypeptidase-like regulatory domain-containing protein [Bacteroidota bacterium]